MSALEELLTNGGYTMKTLTISTGSFDQDNTFTVKPLRYSKCKLFKDYKKEGDGIYWVMQCSAMLKAEYTAKDNEERDRLNSMEPLDKDEVVLIDGNQYKFHYLGNYSDCGYFEPVL